MRIYDALREFRLALAIVLIVIDLAVLYHGMTNL